MSLYDRNYVNEQQNTQTAENQKIASANLSSFIGKTYQLFAASLISAATGAYVGMFFLPQLFALVRSPIMFLVIFIGLYFVLLAVKRVPIINYMMLFIYTFFSGAVLSPIIAVYISTGAGSLVVLAFSLTAIAFGGLSIFAMNTKKDFTFMGKMLFITLIVVIAGILINHYLIQSTWLSFGISSVAVILFSAYILYDTQNIIRGNYETPIEGAIQLYIDVWSMFVHLLNILGILSRD